MIRFLLIFVLFLICSAPVKANPLEAPDSWKSLPILHQGRIKPLDSFARVTLKSFNGKEEINGQSAADWLAQSLFDPASAIETPVFKIFDAQKIGLENRQDKLYSYDEVASVIQNKQDILQTLIQTPEDKLEPEQIKLIDLHEKFIIYTQILRSFTFLTLVDGQEINLQNFQQSQNKVQQKAKKLVKRKGSSFKNYTDEEKKLAATSFQIGILNSSSQNNVILRIIPDQKNDNWLSPWQTLQQQETSPKTLEYIRFWKNMEHAHNTQNTEKWEQIAQEISIQTSTRKLKTEVIYNKLNLIKFTEIFYLLSLSILILGYFYKEKIQFNKFEKIAFTGILIGLTTHIIHILLRIYILDRPPVATLYESILFVSLICAAGCAFLSHKQKTSTGILLGSLSGAILLITAQGFASADTMSTLVAVLNTNFWLGTHVLCISIGYGLCLITSLMAHYYLARQYLTPSNNKIFQVLDRNIKTLAIISLLFTTIGTILGGIWADQSWGRFWGWDPKENGALLIVLWLIWLLHSRLSQHLDRQQFIIGCAFLSIIVVLAWFGVNLLNVGLHSYGFISGVAWGIGIFCVLETVIIGGLTYITRGKA